MHIELGHALNGELVGAQHRVRRTHDQNGQADEKIVGQIAAEDVRKIVVCVLEHCVAVPRALWRWFIYLSHSSRKVRGRLGIGQACAVENRLSVRPAKCKYDQNCTAENCTIM